MTMQQLQQNLDRAQRDYDRHPCLCTAAQLARAKAALRGAWR